MRTDWSFLNRLSLSGLAATLVGNGIGRFAYVALMPVLIEQAWFNRTEAASLGAATLLGYLAGAPLTNWLSRLMPGPALMRTAMLTCSVSYFACAWQAGGFAWFYVWRLLSGVAGAVAMVLGPVPGVEPKSVGPARADEWGGVLGSRPGCHGIWHRDPDVRWFRDRPDLAGLRRHMSSIDGWNMDAVARGDPTRGSRTRPPPA